MSISSEKLRKVLHPIQIDTMHFRFKPRRNPGSQSQHRSVNRTAVWWDEYEAWQKRDLSAKRYVYFWADGIYFSPRLDHDKQCMLVIIAADALGHKDIVGMVDGYR